MTEAKQTEFDVAIVPQETPKPIQAAGMPVTPMQLLEVALRNNAAIDVIERLASLQEKIVSREAEIQFNVAMGQAQGEVGRVAPDLANSQTSSKYASYAALDRVLRPIYTKHGFSLSFDEGDGPAPGVIRVLCYVSHIAGHTRTYRKDMPAPVKGPKGNDVMTATHGAAAADSYGMRYILRKVFNVAIGEDDDDGNISAAADIDAIMASESLEMLRERYKTAMKGPMESKKGGVCKTLMMAYQKRKEELEAQEPA